MSYAQNGLIEATDFNTLVGGNPETGANKLNTVWATGGTTAGYGQTAVSQVAQTVGKVTTGQRTKIPHGSGSLRYDVPGILIPRKMTHSVDQVWSANDIFGQKTTPLCDIMVS